MLTRETYDFLRLFLPEGDLSKILAWNRTPARRLRQLAEKFLEEGYLEEASLEEMAAKFITLTQLKSLAGQHARASTGTRLDIVTRFADDPEPLRKALKGRQVLRVTPVGLVALEQVEQDNESARAKAILESFKAFGNGHFQVGRQIAAEYAMSDANVRDANYISGGIAGPENVEGAVAATAPSVANEPQLLFEARASLGMDSVWQEVDWRTVVAERLTKSPAALRKAENHLLCSAKYLEAIEDAELREGEALLCSVKFHSKDKSSCHLCRELTKSSGIHIRSFPDVPLRGCDSLEGCQFDLVFEAPDDDVEATESSRHHDTSVPERLRRLKELFEMELITQDDFESKKREILEDL